MTARVPWRTCLGLLGALAVVSAHAAPIEVVDDTGRTVRMSAAARRIVSVAPHVTETLFAAGAGSRVVGAVDYSDYPEAAKTIPRVGGSSGLDLEAILALKPDLVIGWASGNPASKMEKLRALGVVVYLSEPRRMEDVARDIEQFGVLAGTLPVAGRVAAAYRARHRKLHTRYAHRPPVRVFYQIWNRPLLTVNGEHLISQAIALCGGENVFSGSPLLTPAVDVEAVFAADPEVIVTGDAPPDARDDWQRWPTLQAVRKGNVFHLPPDLLERNGPRILDGAEQLCGMLETARRQSNRVAR